MNGLGRRKHSRFASQVSAAKTQILGRNQCDIQRRMNEASDSCMKLIDFFHLRPTMQVRRTKISEERGLAKCEIYLNEFWALVLKGVFKFHYEPKTDSPGAPYLKRK